jgi:hypothetical protein
MTFYVTYTETCPVKYHRHSQQTKPPHHAYVRQIRVYCSLLQKRSRISVTHDDNKKRGSIVRHAVSNTLCDVNQEK